MKILAIDTATDETSAAVTEGTKILSSVVWSQASLHAKWGGVVPSLAQRAHEERIDFVVDRAMLNAKCQMTNIDCIAVTVGPGLAIALGVGIDKAKELAKNYGKPLIAINHIEGHLLSPLAQPKRNEYRVSSIEYPAYGLVVSGGNTQIVLIEKIGKYKILAQTVDDALGEALDKAARMLGLGYPGGAVLEKMARLCDASARQVYKLPIPLLGEEKRMIFSYSGLKTAFFRLVEKEQPLTKEKIYNLAASFQDVAFAHLIRVLSFTPNHEPSTMNYELPSINHLLVGGGVSANNNLRKRLRALARKNNLGVFFPYTKRLCTDNAAMVGVAAYFKYKRGEFLLGKKIDLIDREPSAKVDQKFSFEK